MRRLRSFNAYISSDERTTVLEKDQVMTERPSSARLLTSRYGQDRTVELKQKSKQSLGSVFLILTRNRL